MAYTTGTTSGMRAFLDAAGTFLVSNGWTLHDGYSLIDKVFKSVGTDGYQNHYIRIAYESRKLKYYGEVASFTPGAQLSGSTSFASAKILAVVDNGTVGELELYDIQGTFVNGERIVDDNGTPGDGYAGDRAGQLTYTVEGSPFTTIGQTITEAGSGATGILTNVIDNGSTGILTLKNVIGTFTGTAAITGSSNGSATSGTFTAFTGQPAITFGTRRPNPAAPENAMDSLVIRGYNFWNATTHIGTGEFSVAGPWIFTSSSDSQHTMELTRPNNFAAGSANPLVIPAPKALPAGFTTDVGTFDAAVFRLRKINQFDGIRRMMNIHNTTAAWSSGRNPMYDLSSNTFGRPQAILSSSEQEQASGIFVWDKTSDRLYYYTFHTGTTDQNATWQRWNVDTNTWEAKRNPTTPVSALNSTQPRYTRLIYDGTDYIYAVNGASGGLKWGRYQISTDAWVSLTDIPGIIDSGDAASRSNSICYIPKALTGAGEDWIVMFSNGGSSTLWIYRVGANVWKTSGLNLNSLPATPSGQGQGLFWDGMQYLWYAPRNTTDTVYRIDLTNIAIANNAWSSSFTLHTTTGRQSGTSSALINPLACMIRGKQGTSFTYHFVGDADTVTIATTIGTGDSYWAQFGKISGYKNSFVATTTASSGVGPIQSVAVTSSTGFRVGEKVRLLDVTNGTIIAAAVLAKADDTHVTLRLTTSFPSGSRIFVDGIHCVITGDGGWALFGHDAGGYQADNQTSTYRAMPIVDPFISVTGSPDSDANQQMFPFIVFDDLSSTLKSYGSRGTLKHVLALNNAVYPAPIDGDTITDPITSKNYKIFAPKHSRRLPDDRLVAIGPIN